jgi:chemotaxis signal transduction protein
MTISSSRRSRRLASQKQEKTQQLIAFILGQEWFALPINTVQKVVKLGKVYGDPQGTGVSLTNYQGQELLVVDVAHRIFGMTTIPLHQDTNKDRFLLIIENQKNEKVGLPIDAPPSIRRVSESAFIPLPDIYLTQGNIHCISSTMIQAKNHDPLFLLDINQLI